MNKNFFEEKIKPILTYVGAIGAIIMSIAYIICVIVLIVGFEATYISQTIVFAVVNAVIGIIIMQFLKIQGISFAKNIPANKEIQEKYFSLHTKDKKPHSITYFWVTTVLKDVLIKGLSLAATMIGVIYIVIEGSNDYSLLLLALVNLLMFICFGLLSLNNAYEFYNNKHIPFIKDRIKEIEDLKHDN